MSEEVSQLERQPDSLRSAVDPALESHHHQDHMHEDGYTDQELQQQQMEALAQESMNVAHDPHVDGLIAEEHHSGEGFSPRRGFTHKRVEDPPRNAAGKFLCKFQNTCSMMTFDRRCEWR